MSAGRRMRPLSAAYSIFAIVLAAGNAYLGNWWLAAGCIAAAIFWAAAATGLLDRRVSR